MNNTLKAATAFVFATASLGALASPSEAFTGHINGYVAEIEDSGSYSEPDFITVYGPEGEEFIIVTCAPFEWISHGPNRQPFVDSIARAWCF
jgi:hypothetical protein